MENEFSFDDILEVEDALQLANVFLNGLSHTPCHSDSYWAIVDYEALNKWIKEQKFTKSQLTFCVNYWNTNPNVGPILKSVASTIQSKVL